jgi:chromosome segregation ATPase
MQRDIRILNNTLEKTTTERTKLAGEVSRLKELSEKLQYELSIATDTELWKKLITDSREEAAYFKDEAERLQGFIKVREENMTNLEKEVKILRRALNVQKVYESESLNGGAKGTATAKEIIKALYYDLGRCQTDSHNLALTLAEKHKEIENMFDELTVLRQYKTEIAPQIEQLLVHADELAEQNHTKDKQIEDLKGQLNQQADSLQLYELQMQSFAHKLSETESKHAASVKEKDRLLDEYQIALPKAQREAVIAQGRADILQQAIIHHENQTKLAQQRVDVEWSKLSIERSQHDEILKENEKLNAQLNELRQAFTSTLIAKEEISNQYASFKEEFMHRTDETSRHEQAMESQIQELSIDIDHLKHNEAILTKERDEALDALQQTMQVVKDLTNKYKESKALNETFESRAQEMERAMEGMKRAKEHISTAVLDALHKERSKSAALEKILQDMPVERRFLAVADSLSPQKGYDNKLRAFDITHARSSSEEGSGNDDRDTNTVSSADTGTDIRSASDGSGHVHVLDRHQDESTR